MTKRMLNVWCVPAVFTRVSSSSQWILSAASNLSRHPDHFTLDLNITQLSLPGSICSICILRRERESICILWRGRGREREREREREKVVYAKTLSICSSTLQRPLQRPLYMHYLPQLRQIMHIYNAYCMYMNIGTQHISYNCRRGLGANLKNVTKNCFTSQAVD
jgi:hypothetical protein